MGRPQQKREKTLRLDRWATINEFTQSVLAKLHAETGSASAGIVWYVLFTLADGHTGQIRGAGVSKLSRLTNLDRMTVRRAMNQLTRKNLITIHAAGKTKSAVPVYKMYHLEKESRRNE